MSEAPKSLKGTKTEKNLEEAFAGESMARNKLPPFSKKPPPTSANMPKSGTNTCTEVK